MKRLVILFLLSALIFYPYASAGQEKEKGRVVVIDPDDSAMIENWPQWLFLHGYTRSYDSNWMNNYRKGGAIIIRQPRSFGESLLDGLGKGLERGLNNYYRARQQKQDIAFKMGLLELRWASTGRYSKPRQPHIYRNEHRMSVKERQANLDRIKELDCIIEQKYKKREKLNEYLKSIGLPEMSGGLLPEGIYWNGKEWAGKKEEK